MALQNEMKTDDYAEHYQNQKLLFIESYQQAIKTGEAEKAYTLALEAVKEGSKYAEALRIQFKL